MSDPYSSKKIREANLQWNEVHSKLEKLPASSEELWKLFDEIVCINLKERTDRYEKVKALFDSLNMPVKFHQVDKHPNGGVEGCYTSHIQVITSAYERGLKNILIFEDDVVAGKGLTAKKILESLHLSSISGVEVVYLGWHPQLTAARTKHVVGSMYGVKAMGCHAYILPRETMAVLANRPFDGKPIDVVLSEHKKSFGVYPTAFVQGMGDSNITDNFSNSSAMRPLRALAENWAVNVNIPPQWMLYGIVMAIIGIIFFHLLAKRYDVKVQTVGYIILFLAIFMMTVFLLSRRK